MKIIRSKFRECISLLFNLSLFGLCCLLIILLLLHHTKEKEYKDVIKEYSSYKEKTEITMNNLIEENNKLKELSEESLKEKVDELLEYIEPLKEYDKELYMKKYNEIKNKYGFIKEEIYDKYSEEQIYIMCRCIETETYQCPIDAKINVANVILNRVKDEKFPSDPKTVITAPNQFAYHRTVISENTYLALEYAYLHEDTTNNAIAFRSDINPDSWGGWSKCHYDGYHTFYSR